MRIARPEEALLTLAAALCLMPGAAGADVTARLAVGSAYVHRGLDHSVDAPVYQGALEYQLAGWFVGVWASSVQFGAYDDRTSEIDYYLGYGHRFSPQIAVEATAIRYTFLGDSPRDDDWTELQVSAYLADRWTLTWGVADHWWAADAASRFVEATYQYPLPLRLTLDATAGYQLARRAAGVDYGYIEAGVSRRFDDLVVRAGYAGVDSDARRQFPRFAADRWTASLTWQIR